MKTSEQTRERLSFYTSNEKFNLLKDRLAFPDKALLAFVVYEAIQHGRNEAFECFCKHEVSHESR